MFALTEERKTAMGKHTVLRLSHHHGALAQMLPNAGAKLCGWWRKRQNAKVLAELSADQICDCGIESPELNLPSIEVPKGLMQRLISAH
jgi:uncharacterized protein YjiS (DUF1127 family)